MNVGFVNNQYQLGGAETVVQQLWTGLRRAGHEATLFVASGKSYPCEVRPLYPRWLSRLSHTRLHALVERSFPRARWTDRAFRELTKDPCDLIHLHNFHGNYATIESLAYLAAHKPLVWTFHRFWGITGGCDHPGECRRYLERCGQCPRVGEWPIGPIDNTAEELERKIRHLQRAPLHIVAPSRHLAERVTGSRVGQFWPVSYIPNGVNLRRYSFARKKDTALRGSLGIQPTAVTVLVVNRDFKDALKGFSVIAQALQGLPACGIQILLVGREAGWAVQQIPTHHQPVSFGYVSEVEKLSQLYEIADVFLYASPGENFPCVILEAMASRCCDVSTPTDGVLEQIKDGRTGLIAQDMSSEALAAQLRVAITDERLRVRLGTEARKAAECEFSEEGMIENHLRLYQSVLAAQQ